jgi:hypothetical protein
MEQWWVFIQIFKIFDIMLMNRDFRSSSSHNTPVATGGNLARSNNGNWAGRFPEAAPVDGDGSSGETDSDDGDPLGGTANNTLIASRPSSVLGQTSAPMVVPAGGSSAMDMGRSRSGSTANAGEMMIIGSYGAGEFGEMDLDMAVCLRFLSTL